MPKNLTKDEEIDEVLEDLRKAYKANSKAKESLVKSELEVRKTHSQVMQANTRLRALTLDTYE
jgi:hypothetical protein